MKLVVAALLVAAVASQHSPPSTQVSGPWQTGKQYKYRIQAHTLANYDTSATSGTVLRSQLVLRAVQPGRLQGKFENTQHAQFHEQLPNRKAVPENLKFENLNNFDQQFEVAVHDGRVLSLRVPATFSLEYENLLKGLLSAIQVDLSPQRAVKSGHDHFNWDHQQGQFRKMEADITGDCEVFYSVTPLALERYNELPPFAPEAQQQEQQQQQQGQQPIEIRKTKNYGNCKHMVQYHFGIPHNADWTGASRSTHKQQFIEANTESRIVASKDGTIYKSKTTSEVHVDPSMYGQQKAQVRSRVEATLEDVQQDGEQQWQLPQDMRQVQSLIYSLSHKPALGRQGPSSSSSSSSSSSESNEHVNLQHNRARRYIQKNNENMRQNNEQMHNSQQSSSSSSSSSEESSEYTYNNLDVPTFDQGSLASRYMIAEEGENKNNPNLAQKLVNEIAKDIQNPNNMPKADPLSKFNILIQVLSEMNTQQFKQTSRAIEVAKSSNQPAKADAFRIFRDAVAQVGTPSAFQLIKTWIQTNKLQGEEAAQVLATVATTLRYPTKQLMLEFFNLALSDEVRQQKYLNTTALLSASKYINMGQVNNETARLYYPTFMYGRLSRKQDPFVVDDIIPRLEKELKQAIDNDDSHKAQVFIKAIGLIGHRQILNVYAPYFEGKRPTPQYLRMKMVESLSTLARQRDHYVRSVLYSILRNPSESHEVRVAAIHNIYKANPSQVMIHAMAKMTHDDTNIHVRAALKSSLQTLAKLKNQRYAHLTKAAQSVQNMLTEEEFGVQYSSKYYFDHSDEKQNVGDYHDLSLIGSDDSIMPKSLKYSWRNKLNGWFRSNSISASTSSIRQLEDLLRHWIQHSQQQHQQQQQQHQGETQFKFPSEKIEQILKMQRDEPVPLELTLLLNIMNQQRYFTLSEGELQNLPKVVENYVKELAKGVEYHYTKMLNQQQVTVMFPLAMGVPFIFKYKEPTLIHIQGKINMPNQQQPQKYLATINKELDFVYARNIDGRVGFYDPLSKNYASVGIVNRLHVNIPIKAEVRIGSKNIKVHLAPLRPEQDTNIVHYSVWPFSAQEKKDSHVPVSLNTNTKLMTDENKMNNIDWKFGQQNTGIQFQFQGYSQSPDFQSINSFLQGPAMLTKIMTPLHQKRVALTHYNLKYIAKQSQNKGVTLRAAYAAYYKENPNQENSNESDENQNNQNRRQNILQQVSGIENPISQLVDISANFDESRQYEYALTAAVAHSHSEPTIKYALSAHKNSPKSGKYQVKAVGNVIKPRKTMFNFIDALKENLRTNFQMDVEVQQESQNAAKVQVQGHYERSQETTDRLKNSPEAKQCQQQNEKNNYYQPACQKMIARAQVPDHLKVSVTYKDISPAAKNWLYQVYRIARHYGFWYIDENMLKNNPDGKVELEGKLAPFERRVQMTMNTKLGEVRVRNVPVSKQFVRALSAIPPYTTFERLANVFTQEQYAPLCAIDGNNINTFSNRSYEYKLGKSWHVVMQSNNKMEKNYGQNHRNQELVVLARKPGNSNNQEIYIAYRSNNGLPIEIELTPNSKDSNVRGSVKVNTPAQKTTKGQVTIYWKSINKPFVYQYVLPDGTVAINIDEKLRILYDGETTALLPKEYRNRTMGVCGMQSGNAKDDYMTPYGLVFHPQQFGASYSLSDDSNDSQSQQQKEQARRQAYQPAQRHQTILRSDQQWESQMQSQSPNTYRVKSYSKAQGCQIQSQIQYYENHGEICITKEPMPSCTSRCRGQNYEVKRAEVVCRPKIDQEFQRYREQIRQGDNPQVPAGSSVPQMKKFKVPSACQV